MYDAPRLVWTLLSETPGVLGPRSQMTTLFPIQGPRIAMDGSSLRKLHLASIFVVFDISSSSTLSSRLTCVCSLSL